MGLAAFDLMTTWEGARPGERGSALMVSLIALVALLGVGIVTMVSVRSDSASSGAARFHQLALYAAESGVAAGTDFLRNNCSVTDLYSSLVEPSNSSPLEPAGIFANDVQPGQPGNPYDPATRSWYSATILNNPSDAGFAAGDDQDGIVILQVVGHGPDNASATLRVTLLSPSCIAKLCDNEYAQRGINARNDMVAMCATAIDPAAGVRTINP
jgi:hypothetical protein